jgi:hypothetical protein
MSSNALFFGLGAAGAVDSVVIAWPSGIRSVHGDTLVVDAWNTIVEPKTTDIPGDRDRPRVPRFRFGPAYPNPFGAARAPAVLRLPAELARRGRVRVEVFDAAGRRVRVLFDGDLPGGAREFEWDGRDERGREAASGVYRARLLAPGRRAVVPIVLVR